MCPAARILSYRDYTGLEMMRVLREAVDLDAGVEVWNRCPVVELLSDERGGCEHEQAPGQFRH